MVNITVNVALPNIAKYDVVGGFDLNGGSLGFRLYLVGTTRFKDYQLTLSDVAGASRGLILNAAPQAFDDTYVLGGCGLASALTNAQAAYAAARTGAGTHAAGLKAVLLRGVTDQWLDASLAGT